CKNQIRCCEPPSTRSSLKLSRWRRQTDESTTPSDMTIDYKVSSFQINLSSGFENKLLPNDLIIVRNHGDDEEDVGEEFGGVVDQLEAQSKSSSSLLRSPGVARI